ncbi:MAG: ATP-dependent RecD-like DNA helicase, partial [Pseudomonadota bacterium]
LQICIIGDLFQLPPIVSGEEKQFFSQYYSSPFFFSTNSYNEAEFKIIEFANVHRQNDAEFIKALNAIRSGACKAEQLDSLNQRVNVKVTPAPGTLVLTTTNALAENINNTKLAKLGNREKNYKGVLKGDFGMKGARLPAPEQLVLKVGAQVMFVKNDSERRWVNGSIGIVEKLTDDSVTVRTETGLWEVEPEKWKTIGYEFNEEEGKIVEKTLGSYTQFPLILAWAITIHKSQGKTLERVIIDLGSGAFVAGQLYVALSRCKTLSGIAIKQPINQSDISCDEAVVKFMSGLNN